MNKKTLDATKRLMGSLVRMKPKPHDEMRLRPTIKNRQSRKKKAADAKR